MGYTSLCITRGACDHLPWEISAVVYHTGSRSRHAAYGLAPVRRYFQEPNDLQAPKTYTRPQNYSPSHLPCKCKSISANTGKCGRTRHRYAPYGGATRAPSESAHPSPLPEPPTINTGPYNYRALPNKATKKPDPPTSGKCRSAILHTAPYGGAVRPPRKSAHPNQLSELAALTYKPQMLRDTKPNLNSPAALLPTEAQLLTEIPRAGSPCNEMRPRNGTGITARTRPRKDRLRKPPHPRTPNSARIQRHAETHHPKGRDSWKRHKTGEALESVCPPLQ